MKKLLITSCLFILGLFAHSQQQNLISEKLDAYLQSALEAYKFNGVALVAKGNDIILHKAYGWKNYLAKLTNDTATKFPILSITKSFTSIVVLKLQEEGKLSLKDKVSKYLPGFPNLEKISIEQLLTHNSGLYNYTNVIGEEDSALVNHPVPRQLLLDVFINKPLEFIPGKDFSYNNSGYILAGMIIEKVTGKSYDQNVQELIFAPLKMSNSGFNFNGLSETDRAIGYQFLNGGIQKPYTYLDSTVSYSAGDIYSTTGDLFKWVRAIAAKQILTKKSWQDAFTRKASDYGIGFRINQYGGKQYIKHSGGYPGFASEFVYYPANDITIIFLRNAGNYGDDVWPLTMGMSDIVFGRPYDLWKKHTEVKLDSAQLSDKVGSYSGKGVKIQVLFKEGQLYALFPGLELPLLADSDTNFYLYNFNTTLTFQKDGQGKIVSVSVHERGSDTIYKKND